MKFGSRYFAIARKRIEAAQMQPRLLDVEPPPPLRQAELDASAACDGGPDAV